MNAEPLVTEVADKLHAAYSTGMLFFLLGVIPAGFLMLAMAGKDKGGPIYLVACVAYIACWSAKWGMAVIIGHVIGYILFAALLVIGGLVVCWPLISIFKKSME